MESFNWDESFEIGVLEVDRQHRHLVDLTNQLSAQITANSLDETAIEALFHELFDYTLYHFQEEEKLMRDNGIDQRHLDFHIDKHHRFVNKLVTIHGNISPLNLDEVEILLNFLIHWLVHHILGCDQNMARQIAAIQAHQSPAAAYEKEEDRSETATNALISALSNLFQLVATRNQELEQLNQSLEAKVAERTSALSAANRELKTLALTDMLTHLPNRRHGMQRLTQLWQESSANQTPLTCLMIDADHFKAVNDTYGHEAGDAVLQALARTLQHSVRNDDVVCRMGGDEFLILCPNTDFRGSLHIAHQIYQEIAHLTVPVGTGNWNGSASIGVTVRTAEMDSYTDLIRAADQAVYAAKQAGRNCVRHSFNQSPALGLKA
jgi:diguanylate cyclase (GGDEF)-like protein/hemerythrin-like metal-binding protein